MTSKKRKRQLGSVARSALGIALGLLTLGCAKQQTQAPAYPEARTVVAEPAPTQGVFVQQSQTYRVAPAEVPEAIGYETLSSGEQVVVVEYVHTYPDAVDSFPHVVWSGRTYYNVHGDFVYWSDDWGWCYYLGPPAPLVVSWNGYYPWAPYAWGVGYYGAGYYWGGVGMYGYHAYGLSVAHHDHHHYAYHQNDRRPGRDARPSAGAKPAPSRGGPTDGGVSPGAPTRPPARDMNASRRNPSEPSGAQGGPPPAARRRNPARMPSGPVASRRNPSNAPVRGNGYTTAGGQKITVIDPRGTTTAPGVRRNPASSRPTFRNPSARRRNPPAAAPAFAAPSSQPTRTQPKAPARANPTPAAPSWGANYNKQPSRSNPKPSSRQPSRRNNAPSSTAPTRSRRSTPSRSNPRRSSPSRSNPTRSAPSRSAPRRSAPTRSAPRRSAPTRSAPKRSSPSRRSPKAKKK